MRGHLALAAVASVIELDRSTVMGRSIVDGDVVHVPDVQQLDPVAYVRARELAQQVGWRAALSAPMLRDDGAIGCILLRRPDPGRFTPRQIELLETFAAQAVIAIENARLLTEQREALEQQTATAEVLQVINASPGDLAPVFDAMLEKAMTLCGAAFGFLTSYDGQRFTPVAMRGVPPSLAKYFTQGMDQPSPGEAHFRILQGEDVIHNLDQKDEEAYRSGLPLRRAVVDLGGARTALVVALRKDGAVLGALTIYRKEVRPFSDKQIALMRNFAAQAVIAIENARLLRRNAKALERQTATAEVLQVINSSPGDLTPVFDAMLEKATRLCQAAFGIMNTYDGERYHTVALYGVPAAMEQIFRDPAAPQLGPNSPPMRLTRGEDIIHIQDLAAAEETTRSDPRGRALVTIGRARSYVIVALRKDGRLLGSIAAYRQEMRPFSDKQIALLQNFAAQAVIAMENARLLERAARPPGRAAGYLRQHGRRRGHVRRRPSAWGLEPQLRADHGPVRGVAGETAWLCRLS